MYQNKCGEFVVGYCVVKADVHPLCFAVVVIVLRLPYCPFQQSDWLTAVIQRGLNPTYKLTVSLNISFCLSYDPLRFPRDVQGLTVEVFLSKEAN